MAKDENEVQDHFEEELISTILALRAAGMSETEVRRLVEHTLNKARRG